MVYRLKTSASGESRMQEPQSTASLQANQQSGARWFYWIGGLSLFNTASTFAAWKMHFVLGLGLTQVVDQLAISWGHGDPIAKAIALGIDIVVAGAFFAFGALAKNNHNWAFIFGMVFFALDGALCLLCGDMMSAAFHVFALWCIFTGFRSAQALAKLQAAAAKTVA
jgi:hypothetical protein